VNTNKAIDKLLNPASIAIVGASNNKSKHGGRLIDHLMKHHYPGNIYPVNPKEEMIQGFTCYKSIEEIPYPVDLVCILVSPTYLMDILKACAKKNIQMVMIHASGFAEIGEDGEHLQKEIVGFAREHGIRICGPNTIGVANVNQSVFASFSMSMTTENIPTGGTISYITQSGAIGGAMLSQGWEKLMGINKWISSGNEADLDTADYIDYVVEDDSTNTICVFLEGLKDGKKFKQALTKAANAEKPVIIYKNGRSEIGQKSVKSHTGVLAGNHEVYNAVFRQFGVTNAEDLDDLFDYAIAFDSVSLPEGNRVGIISTSGGACTIVTDNSIKHGLSVPELTEQSKQRLLELAPAFSTPQNPFDTTAQILSEPETFKRSLEVFVDDENIDVVIVMLTTLAGSIAETVADHIIDLSKTTKKPLFVAWTIAESLAQEGMAKLRKANIPLYPSAERAVNSVSALNNFNQFRQEWKRKKDYYSEKLLENKVRL
jgi:acyl-CoA synthetase (NDP forming)